MNIFLTSMKRSLFIIFLDLLIFFFVFFIIEVFYLNKDFLIGAKVASVSTFIRIIYLQVLVQFVAVSVCFYFTKNVYVLFAVMVVMFFSYYSFLRGELIPFEQLLGFGSYGKTTPSFLVFLISSFFTVISFKQLKHLSHPL